MNDKDLDAFNKWLEIEFGEEVDKSRSWLYEESIFRFACEYKNKEVDSYKAQLVCARQESSKNDSETITKLNQENKKLRECVEYYADLDDECIGYDIRGVTTAREALKEITTN